MRLNVKLDACCGTQSIIDVIRIFHCLIPSSLTADKRTGAKVLPYVLLLSQAAPCPIAAAMRDDPRSGTHKIVAGLIYVSLTCIFDKFSQPFDGYACTYIIALEQADRFLAIELDATLANAA